MEAAILRALEDVKIRSTVEECLKEMVMDVEIADKLEEKLANVQELKYLKEKVVEQEWALEESKLILQERCDLQKHVADDMVRELWALSRQMGELKQIKQNHEDLLIQYDEVVAKLIQMEEELVEAKQRNDNSKNDGNEAPAGESITKQSIVTAKPEKREEVKGEMLDEIAKEESKEIERTKVELEATIVELPEPSVPFKKAISVEIPEPLEIETNVPPSIQQPLLDNVEDEPSPKVTDVQPESVVALEQDTQEDTPTLESLDTKILMQIFAYLDALDILNTAQVNISMYSRIDTLFGLGNGSGNDSVDNSTIATVETAATPSQTIQNASGMTSKVIEPETQIGPSSPPSSSPSHHFLRRAESSPLTTASAAEGIRGLFSSMLQPSRGGKFGPSPPRTPLRSNSDAHHPMNAALASSMASKLSDAELNAIIVMTERLRQKEILVEKLTQEKSDLATALQGSEGVKQFLIAKVRDMEGTLAAIGDNESKISQQIASDQEVIAFLDGRVQELEQEAQGHKKSDQEMRDQIALVKQQAEQKAVVMGDMLQFEREKWTENEREWRATKRLLVKEVKNCRKQIMVLQAERDGYREQNEVLRKAVLSSQPTSGV